MSLDLSSAGEGCKEIVSAENGKEASGGGDTQLAVPSNSTDEDDIQDEVRFGQQGGGGDGDGDTDQEITALPNEEDVADLGKHGCLPCGMSFG